MISNPRLRRYAVLCSILVSAFALRIFYLNERGLWYDEAFAILYAARSFAEMIAGTLTQVDGAAADVHPLFYYFSLHTWMQWAGDSVFAARFYSVFFGVATLPIIFSLSRRLFSKRVAMASILIVALAPFHLAYSQEARMYAQLGFWSALAFLAFVRYSRGAGKHWWSVFVVSGACALYSHNLAFFSFVALGMWTIGEAIRTRSIHLLRATILAGGAMLVLWLPWLVVVPSQLGKIQQAYWVAFPTLVTLFQTLLVFTFGFDNAAVPPMLLPILLFVTIILFVFLGLQVRRWIHRDAPSLGLTLTMAFLPIALLFIVSQWRPVYIIRALMPAFLWYAICIGWMLAGMPRLVYRTFVVVLGAIVLVLLPAYYTYAEFPRSPFKQADAMLRAKMQPGDGIIHDNKMTYFPMHYYDPKLAQSFIADPAGAGSDTLALPTQQALGLYATSIDAEMAGKSRVWFVIFQLALDQANESGESQGNMARLDATMTRHNVIPIGDLRILEYVAR
ncbi:MAG: glycosyltransferase family 39 protein [Chloroflexi bacterium]|nr:glycosyltransferase family 39 protein [Chloroflexota bacterium]